MSRSPFFELGTDERKKTLGVMFPTIFRVPLMRSAEGFTYGGACQLNLSSMRSCDQQAKIQLQLNSKFLENILVP